MAKKKELKARAVVDLPRDAEDVKRKFYVFEGFCSKCGCGEHSLIVYDVVPNEKSKASSIYRHICLYCGHKDMTYSKDIEVIEDEKPDDPPPKEPA